MIAAAISIVIAILVVKLAYDYNLWLSSKPVNHTKEWILMAVFSIPAIVLFTLQSELGWWLAAPLSGAMIAFFIWFLFDGIYNILRGFDWFFTGSDDADDPATDNFLQSLKLWQHILIKVGILSLLITIYIFNYGD